MSDGAPERAVPALDAPLAGVRVVDVAAGAMAGIGRLLAELGAEVVRIAPPAGAGARVAGPVVDGLDLRDAIAGLGKRDLPLDLTTEEGRAGFAGTVARADILIETSGPATGRAGTGGAAWIDADALAARHPALVILSISDFGRDTAFSGWQATDAVFHALSGALSRSGIPGRAPLLPPGDLAYDCAVAQAAYVALLAYYDRLRTGRGEQLDFSLMDAAAQALDPGYGIGGSATAGVPASALPRGRPEARHQYPIVPCADGFVRLCVLAPRQWQGMFEWMGRPEAFADPSYNLLRTRFTSPTLIPAIAAFFAGQSRGALEEAGQRHGVPTGALLDLSEALATPQIEARGLFRPIELAPGLTVPVPDGMMEIDGVRAGPHAAADRPAEPAEPPRVMPWGEAGTPPLAGLRVLDLGVIVVGAEQGRLLADQGADVIKVENAAFPDGSRQVRDGGAMSMTFAAGHRNKRGLSLNLRDPAGRDLFLALAAKADVVLSNFKPGTLESLGLGAAALAEANPRLILLDSSAYGPSGPWSRRLGYGPLVRASAGLTARWRYPGEPESFSDALTVYPDHVAGRIGAVGTLALLIRRLRTARGGTVSIAQAEIMLGHMAPEVAAMSLGLELDERGELPRDAPWDVFPCAGDDDWCVVTVRDNADWRALCGVLARPDLAADPALADRYGRAAARAAIDGAVAEWLAGIGATEAMTRLQVAGVPAGAMLRVSELPAFDYYRERGLFRTVDHPFVRGAFPLETRPARAQHLPDPAVLPAPLVGEHSEAVLRDWLDLDAATIAGLVAAGIVGVADEAELAMRVA